MTSASIKKQTIETFGLSDKEFEHSYRIDVADPARGFWPGALQVNISASSLELQAKLNKEYNQLVQDWQILCWFIFLCLPASPPHYLPANLFWIMPSNLQIFHIDHQKPCNLGPACS